MTGRTTQVVVHFANAFHLRGIDGPQPAGDYRIDHDEECIEGMSWVAWHRTGSFIHLPRVGARAPTREMISIDPLELAAALEKDKTL